MTELNEPSAKESNSLDFRLSETALLAIIPILAYGWIFLVKLGKSFFYRIPMSLLSFSLLDNVGSVAALSMFVVFTLLIVALNLAVLGQPIERRKRIPFILFLGSQMTFILGVLTVLYSAFSIYRVGLQLGDNPFQIKALVGITLYLLFMIVAGYRANGIWNRASNYTEIRSGFYTAVVATTIILATSAFVFGLSNAVQEPNYYVLQKPEEMVVLDFSRDRLVLSSFDRSTKTLGNQISIIAYQDIDGQLLTLEKVGPLEPYRPPVQLGE